MMRINIEKFQKCPWSGKGCLRAIGFLVLFNFLFSGAYAQEEFKTLAITQIVSHPALDAVRDGVLEGLAKEGFIEGKNLTVLQGNAQGNISLAAQIAQKFVGQEPDAIMAIATPSAQTAKSADREHAIPIVFAAVTDPIAAKLVKSLEKPGSNVTGVTDFPPMEKQVALIKQILPNLKSLGVLYNPGEANSVAQVDYLKKIAPNIQIVEMPVAKATEILTATQAILPKVDAIYIPLDNTVVSALENVIAVAHKEKIPVFASDSEGVRLGALGTVGISHFEQGLQVARLLARVLRGENPGGISVVQTKAAGTYINKKSAGILGITVPPRVISKAEIISGE